MLPEVWVCFTLCLHFRELHIKEFNDMVNQITGNILKSWIGYHRETFLNQW